MSNPEHGTIYFAAKPSPPVAIHMVLASVDLIVIPYPHSLLVHQDISLRQVPASERSSPTWVLLVNISTPPSPKKISGNDVFAPPSSASAPDPVAMLEARPSLLIGSGDSVHTNSSITESSHTTLRNQKIVQPCSASRSNFEKLMIDNGWTAAETEDFRVSGVLLFRHF